jgi:nicotinamide riboside kinase
MWSSTRRFFFKSPLSMAAESMGKATIVTAKASTLRNCQESVFHFG